MSGNVRNVLNVRSHKPLSSNQFRQEIVQTVEESNSLADIADIADIPEMQTFRGAVAW
jgi:transposase-like protein